MCEDTLALPPAPPDSALLVPRPPPPGHLDAALLYVTAPLALYGAQKRVQVAPLLDLLDAGQSSASSSSPPAPPLDPLRRCCDTSWSAVTTHT